MWFRHLQQSIYPVWFNHKKSSPKLSVGSSPGPGVQPQEGPPVPIDDHLAGISQSPLLLAKRVWVLRPVTNTEHKINKTNLILISLSFYTYREPDNLLETIATKIQKFPLLEVFCRRIEEILM